MNTIKPELGGGFRDYLPDDEIPRQEIIGKIIRVYERFGFAPLQTPILERTEVLTGGDPAFKKQIFRARLGDNEENLGLRFDLTIPLARVVAANADKISFPFKRYQIGKVWRGESPQKGRYREFIQCDADIVGSSNTMADAEIIALTYRILAEIGLQNFVIKVSDLDIFKKLNLGNKFRPAMQNIDKTAKIGMPAVRKELEKILGKVQTETTVGIVLEQRTTEKLDTVLANVKLLGVPKDALAVDNTIVRGLDYYTGIVFEVALLGSSMGSIGGGGRYDNLIERFSPLKIPAVGVSIGFDRLFSALDELGLVNRKTNISKVLILNFEPSCQEIVQNIFVDLQKNEIQSEIYLGQEETIKGQIPYAVKKEYPFVLIIGKEEKNKKTVQLKDMNARQQTEISLSNIVRELKKRLL